jgi:hypothetical protein
MAKHSKTTGVSTVPADRALRSVSVVLGDAMEYRIARLFVYQGYFVRRGREILTVAGLDKATDLDVLALRFRELFSLDSIIVECKTGGEGPLDRVFWLSGVKTFVRADRAFLFRRPTKWNIKDFAKRAGVEIIDEAWLDQLEAAHLRDKTLWPGICDQEFIKPRLAGWNAILRRDQRLRELFLTLSTEARFDSPFAGVNFWVHHLRGLTRSWNTETGTTKELVAFLVADAVGQLSVFLMKIAQFGADLRREDRVGMVEKGLTYGESDPMLTKRVFDHAYHLSKATLREYLTRDVPLDRALFTIPRPDHVDAITAAVEDIVTHSIQATTFPQIADLIMAERFLKSIRNQGVLRQIFPSDGLAARVALVRNYLLTLVSLGALPDEVKQIFDARQAEPFEPGDQMVGPRASAPVSQAGLFGVAEAPQSLSRDVRDQSQRQIAAGSKEPRSGGESVGAPTGESKVSSNGGFGDDDDGRGR